MALISPFIVHFPRNFTSNLEGYQLLAGLSLDTFSFKKKDVILNLINNEYFDANLCAPLGSLVDLLRKNGNTVAFWGVPADVENAFYRNGFSHIVNASEHDQRNYTTIVAYKNFSLTDTTAFQEYIQTQLLDYETFPKASPLLKRKINKSIFEIYNNAHIHGRCDRVFTCGQYSDTSKMLKFCISDMGVTIRKNVNLYYSAGNKISGEEAINWAVNEGNTTKIGQVPGGLGFSLIRDFLKLNGGSIQVISSDGYWHESKGERFSMPLNKRFLGTIVNLEFNLDDKSHYRLASEINFKDIL